MRTRVFSGKRWEKCKRLQLRKMPNLRSKHNHAFMHKTHLAFKKSFKLNKTRVQGTNSDFLCVFDQLRCNGGHEKNVQDRSIVALVRIRTGPARPFVIPFLACILSNFHHSDWELWAKTQHFPNAGSGFAKVGHIHCKASGLRFLFKFRVQDPDRSFPFLSRHEKLRFVQQICLMLKIECARKNPFSKCLET